MFTDRLRQIVTDDEKRIRTQFISVYGILGLVSLFMTLMNILSSQPILLTLSTLFFGVLSLGNCILVWKSPKSITLSESLFIVEIFVLFTYFIISGTPEGFSILWSLLLPSCGLFLLQKKMGSLLSGLLFCELVFLFWTPAGKEMLRYSYNATFMMRFPVLFLAFYFVGLFLETIRALTFENFRYLYQYDALTDVMNRRGFNSYMEKAYHDATAVNVGFLICDLDKFKEINDELGHLAGDEMLRQTAQNLQKIIGLPLCRWGGEEFAAFDPSGTITSARLNEYCRQFEAEGIFIDGKRIPQTISIGGVLMRREDDHTINQLLSQADIALYNAKENGRNQADMLDFTK